MGGKMAPLTVVCWKWKPSGPYRSNFDGSHVNVLRNMVERHLHVPHEFVCITDDDDGIDSRIRVVPLWDDFASVPSPWGKGNPSCYRRLRAFAPESKEILGERILSIDLDCVIVGDITPLVETEADFKIWGDTAKGTPYNGSLWLLKAGSRSQVWTEFDPVKSPQIGKSLGYVGSDQAWIAACLGQDEKKWTARDGIYSFRNEIKHTRELPTDARMVMFHGQYDPWMMDVRRKYPWIDQHWR